MPAGIPTDPQQAYTAGRGDALAPLGQSHTGKGYEVNIDGLTKQMEYEYRHWVESDRVPSWLAPARAEAQLALHAPIVEALEQADADAALAAVRRHHDVMREHLLSREG